METLPHAPRAARSLCMSIAVHAALTSTAMAQIGTSPGASHQEVSLSGPRFGVTYLSQGIVDWARRKNVEFKSPVITQFGWQFEKQMATGDGPTAVSEVVLLAGGLDQGLFVPSASWVVGLRTHSGFEFGVGPNLSPTGVALVVGAGMTTHIGALNIPLNVAIVPSRDGVRTSVLTGFSVQP
jgi:hypothetical protein